jgi:hypothetical protein
VDLTLADFADATGTIYDVAAPDGEHKLTLVSASELTPAVRPGGSFKLEFRGPFEPILEQAIYPFRAGDFAQEIFIVPVTRDDTGTLYEAIFN